MYSLVSSGNPSNWLGPVWIIVNYLVWQGLTHYGFENEARDLADKTIKLLASDLATAAKSGEAPAFADALTRIQKRCDACHADFRF